MTRFIVLIAVISIFASCRSTKKIQTAIGKKDSTSLVSTNDKGKNDTLRLIDEALRRIDSNQIDFHTFSAKVNADYKGSDGKSYNLNLNIRMQKDSAIWMIANATILGLEAMRVLITRDSVKLLDKLNKTYTARSVDYLKDVTALPLDLHTLQDLIVG